MGTRAGRIGWVVALWVTALGLAGSAAAADLKVGVVDLQRCLNESKVGKEYKTRFSTEADEIKSALEKEEAELKTLREQLEAQGMILSETARQEKEREYKEKVEAFKERFKASQQTLQRKDQELTQKILKDLQGVIREIAETGGYALVVERREGGVLFVPATADLTDEVIRAYDRSGE